MISLLQVLLCRAIVCTFPFRPTHVLPRSWARLLVASVGNSARRGPRYRRHGSLNIRRVSVLLRWARRRWFLARILWASRNICPRTVTPPPGTTISLPDRLQLPGLYCPVALWGDVQLLLRFRRSAYVVQRLAWRGLDRGLSRRVGKFFKIDVQLQLLLLLWCRSQCQQRAPRRLAVSGIDEGYVRGDTSMFAARFEPTARVTPYLTGNALDDLFRTEYLALSLWILSAPLPYPWSIDRGTSTSSV